MPHIVLKKIDNCRDLSHIVTKDGRMIKKKSLIRSEKLSKCSKKDLKKLTDEYGLKTIIDLRTDIECEQSPDPEIPGVEYVRNPILEAKTLGITREKVAYKDVPKIFKDVTETPEEHMSKLYHDIVLEDYAKAHYKSFFELLLEKDGAILWHCTAGKDRVGLCTALLLYALGVDRETIIADYLMTDYYFLSENRKLKFLINIGVRKKLVRDHLRFLLSVKRQYITASFDAIEENYGSIENYLREEMGLDYEKITLLQNKFLEYR